MQIISTDADIDSNLGIAFQICLWSFIFTIFYIAIVFIKNALISARETKFGGEEE